MTFPQLVFTLVTVLLTVAALVFCLRARGYAHEAASARAAAKAAAHNVQATVIRVGQNEDDIRSLSKRVTKLSGRVYHGQRRDQRPADDDENALRPGLIGDEESDDELAAMLALQRATSAPVKE